MPQNGQPRSASGKVGPKLVRACSWCRRSCAKASLPAAMRRHGISSTTGTMPRMAAPRTSQAKRQSRAAMRCSASGATSITPTPLADHAMAMAVPSRAANLARATHAPNAVLIYESGTIGAKPEHLPLSIGDGELAETADVVVSVPEIFSYWLQGGRIDVGFLGAAQIDRFANLNSTVIGDYDQPKGRLPGGGGAPEIAAWCRETFVILRQSPRTFVERLDFHGRVLIPLEEAVVLVRCIPPHAAGQRVSEPAKEARVRLVLELRLHAEHVADSVVVVFETTAEIRVARDELGLVRQTELVMQFKKD